MVDVWRVWNDLRRREEALRWGERQPGVGPQYDSMGRPAHTGGVWGADQLGRVSRVRKALNITLIWWPGARM